jgi:hypothetical protein
VLFLFAYAEIIPLVNLVLIDANGGGFACGGCGE